VPCQTVEISALVLDFDGVVLESAAIKTEAFIQMFEDYPEHRDAIVEYHLKNLGMSRFKKFSWIYRELLKKPLPRETLELLGARFSALVFEKILKAPFVPGAWEALEATRRTGLPVFVVSGTPHDELVKIIELRGLKDYFKDVWGSPMEKTAALRTIRSKFGLGSGEMLFVGDGYFDYEAARTEGVPFLARDSGDGSVDWSSCAVPKARDLTPVAELLQKGRVPLQAPGQPEATVFALKTRPPQ